NSGNRPGTLFWNPERGNFPSIKPPDRNGLPGSLPLAAEQPNRRSFPGLKALNQVLSLIRQSGLPGCMWGYLTGAEMVYNRFVGASVIRERHNPVLIALVSGLIIAGQGGSSHEASIVGYRIGGSNPCLYLFRKIQ